MNRSAAASASTPTGTLIRKTGRHAVPAMSALVRIAPSTGPSTVASPASALNAPIALARSSGG